MGRVCLALGALTVFGCATVVDGHQRALFYSASHGMNPQPVGSGWYWHWPWNSYVKYDLRWTSHREEIHIHSRDGLHMNLDVVVVVRPDPKEIFPLDTDVGPGFYEAVVKPAVYGASRDASGRFTHLEIVTQTHEVERAIREALVEHLHGQHLQLGEVAIQHFDLPAEVEQATARKAATNQALAAKDIELHLAERDAEIDRAKRRGVLEIEEMRRKADRDKALAEAETLRIRSESEAQATRVRAEADRARIQSLSNNLSPNYVRIQALEALAKAMSGDNVKMMIMPVGANGLPSFFTPFLDPYAKLFGAATGGK